MPTQSAGSPPTYEGRQLSVGIRAPPPGPNKPSGGKFRPVAGFVPISNLGTQPSHHEEQDMRRFFPAEEGQQTPSTSANGQVATMPTNQQQHHGQSPDTVNDPYYRAPYGGPSQTASSYPAYSQPNAQGQPQSQPAHYQPLQQQRPPPPVQQIILPSSQAPILPDLLTHLQDLEDTPPAAMQLQPPPPLSLRPATAAATSSLGSNAGSTAASGASAASSSTPLPSPAGLPARPTFHNHTPTTATPTGHGGPTPPAFLPNKPGSNATTAAGAGGSTPATPTTMNPSGVAGIVTGAGPGPQLSIPLPAIPQTQSAGAVSSAGLPTRPQLPTPPSKWTPVNQEGAVEQEPGKEATQIGTPDSQQRTPVRDGPRASLSKPTNATIARMTAVESPNRAAVSPSSIPAAASAQEMLPASTGTSTAGTTPAAEGTKDAVMAESTRAAGAAPGTRAAVNGELYERLAQVGEGTYGKVYKAKNVETGQLVGLKRIRMETEKDGFPVTSIREIKLLQSLNHENVIKLQEMMVSKGEGATDRSGLREGPIISLCSHCMGLIFVGPGVYTAFFYFVWQRRSRLHGL